MAPLTFEYGSAQLMDPPENTPPTLSNSAAQPVPDMMAAQPVGSTALLPYRSLERVAAVSSLPVVIENGAYKLQRRVALVTDDVRFPRPPVQTTQRVTVFGRAPTVRTSTTAHHPAGWDRELVLANGQPDIQAIEKAIGKVSLPTDVKVRLNFIEAAWFAQVAYDNPVPLLVNFLRLYFKQLLLETVSHSEYVAVVAYADHQDWIATHITTDANGKRQWVNIDLARNSWEKLLRVGMAPAAFVYHWGNAQQTYDEFSSLASGTPYAARLSVFEVPEYNDGHSSISRYRFEQIGFVDGRYLRLPMEWNTCWPTAEFPNSDLFLPRHGVSIQIMGGVREPGEYAYIHGGGLEDSEIVTVFWAYLPSPTTTPFAVDMDVPMPSRSTMLRINRPERDCFAASVRIHDLFEHHKPSAAHILRTCLKLVYLNRWEEAFFEAVRYITPFVAQPEPDTIEGHLWFAYDPELFLPRLGLYRGVHSMFVSGDALVLTHDPRQVHANATATVNGLLTYGPITRALLQWGEYLYHCGNRRDLVSLGALETDDQGSLVKVQYHAPGMLSGVTGVDEASYPWAGTGVYVGRDTRLKIFGPQALRVDTLADNLRDQLEELQVRVTPHSRYTTLVYKRIGPPAGLPLVVGGGGLFTQGTPLAPQFTLTKVSVSRHWRTRAYDMDWGELWCWICAHRWFGFDVLYKMPATPNTGVDQVGWAANGVVICPPPPVIDTAKDTDMYRVHVSPTQRKYSWSLPTEDMADGAVRKFTWQLEDVWCTRGLEFASPLSEYTLGGQISCITYDPGYADLFLGLARLHVRCDPAIPQVFQIQPSTYTRLAAGQIPCASAEPSTVVKDTLPETVIGESAPLVPES